VASFRVVVPPSAAELTAGFDRVRAELELPEEFPPDVVAEAEAAVAKAPGAEYADATDLELLTIDPPGSMDLDQAMHLERAGAGYLVHYAIADPGFFMSVGGALDTESRRRGQTLYSPDTRTPLYPAVLSENGGSLLPDQQRPSVLWRFELDSSGVVTAVTVRRAVVRSRRRLTYDEAQLRIDNGPEDEPLLLLREVGRLRQEIEAARGGVTLDVPEQEVVRDGDGYRLQYRAPLGVEDWNAQISLLTGMSAAEVMLGARVGLLRTLPTPDRRSVEALRRSAKALGVDWPAETEHPEFIRSLDAAVPAHAALLTLSTSLLRGAGYVAFDGTPPESALHSAIAAPYAHATAPLRRLADRFVAEVCVAACAGVDPPGWARAALPGLPPLMSESDRRARALERAVLDYVEAAVLRSRVGETFDGVVVEAEGDDGVVQIADPAVRARLKAAGLPLGEQVRVTLVAADPAARTVQFARA
jgi:exoribonuclease R